MVAAMAASWNLVVLCILTAGPHALLAFLLPSSSLPSCLSFLPPSRSAWSGVCRFSEFPATGRLGSRVDARGRPQVARSLKLQKVPMENQTLQGSGYGEISVESEGILDALLALGVELEQLRVEGAVTGEKTHPEHPVLKILQDRRASGSRTRP